MRKLLQGIIYYIVPLAGLAILVIYPEKEYLNYAGWVAIYSLAAVLLLHPLQILIGGRLLKYLMTFRREIGILCFWTALTHGVGNLIRMNFNIKWHLLHPSAWGYIALSIIVILGLTSNNASIRIFKLWWKYIQRLAYPALFIGLMHIELVKFKTFYMTPIAFALYSALRIWTSKIEQKRLNKPNKTI